MGLTVNLIEKDKEFVLLKEIWTEFEKEVDHINITSSYTWLSTWWHSFKDIENNTIGFNKELLIILVYENNKLVAIAPFVKLIRKKWGVNISFIEFISQQVAGTYIDIICNIDPIKNKQYIINWLKQNIKYDILLLRHIPEHTICFDKDFLIEYSFCPQISLKKSSSFAEFKDSSYSKKLKQNIRTSFNKAKRNDAILEYKSEAITQKNINEIIRISRSKLNNNKEWLYGDKTMSGFYKSIFEQMDSNVLFIYLNNENIAYRANVIYNNTKFCVDASFDRDSSKYDPGILSVNYNIKDSFDKGLLTHCLGPGVDPYKMKFSKRVVKIYSYIEKGNTFWSNFLFYFLKRILIKKHKEFVQMYANVLLKH
jgi:hypothetical protein